MTAHTKKLLIEIGNNEYYRCVEEAEESVPTDLEEAVANGIVLDGLTNGEIMQKMLPDVKVEECNKDVEGNPHLYRVHGLDGVTDFTANWWNRKWGEET